MHLTTLALLQALKLPSNDLLNNVVHYTYMPDEWQCTTLPSSFSQSVLQKKCPSVLNEVNVCCAVWNDCFEQKKGEKYCNKQYYGCNQIALSSASPEDFKQCQRFPAEVKDHLEYISPRPADLVLPAPSLFLSETPLVAKVYETCPTKERTFSACLHNAARDQMAFSALPSKQVNYKQMSFFNLRVCMEMTIAEEDGVDCKQSVERLLEHFESSASYTNNIKKMQDRSEWKCGSTRYDTYVTQVIAGVGCTWLKEAFNTCCKHHSECYEKLQEKEKCDKAWDSCNAAVISNGDGTVAKECVPFVDWASNYETITNVYSYEKEAVVVEEEQLYFWIIVFICTFAVLLTVFFIGSLFRRQRTPQSYDACDEKLTTTESLP